MIKRLLAVITVFFASIQFVSAQLSEASLTIHVAAAANLQAVLSSKIIPAFESQCAIQVIPVFGATKVLAQQEENGAPFDVFIAADTATVEKLAGENLLDKASIKPYAIGTLVIWTSNTTGLHPKSISDLTGPSYQHIAVANPKTAPYGEAAIESITSANLLDTLTPKIVYAENISQALQYAVSGNADAAFTALSLVIDRTDGSYIVVPDKLHKPIIQSLALAPYASPSAKLFAAYLTSKAVNKIWSASGYRLP